ncbi:hypothetical protein [Desulfosporosinus youngiae]|uniref:Uncharacterized protein n=1 Tax=Desulfosporosinus youngiae DSM 17734 TaxID=768710 RepID=H5XY34_9FIRM|nr:hypothetical protein [Desulfosporosinus youngiae]EHQ91537.1 hypothetical protein DesyoDRAFT_4583 [Desulfosporosinus youngiae DSM 17734]
MDEKLMEVLNKILESQTIMTKRLDAVETLKEDLKKNTMELGTLREDLKNNTMELHNHGLTLEAVQTNIKIIVEVQQNFMVQSERRYEEINKHIDDKTNLLESILKRVSADLEDLKEDKRSTDEILGRHEVAIRSLRRRYV